MNTRTKFLLAGVLATGLLALGAVSAHGAYQAYANAEGGPGAVCDENMTVGECREAMQGLHEESLQERHERCVEAHGQEFCDAQREKMQERHAAHDNGTHRPGHGHHRGPGHFRAHGAGFGHGAGHDCPASDGEADSGDGNTTAA